MVAGICAGLAEYFEVDPTIVRVIFVLLTVPHGAGLLIYLIMWVIVPEAPVSRKKGVEPGVAASAPASDSTDKESEGAAPGKRPSHVFWGGILVVLGGILLLDAVLPIRLPGEVLVPAALVGAGVVLIARSFDS